VLLTPVLKGAHEKRTNASNGQAFKETLFAENEKLTGTSGCGQPTIIITQRVCPNASLLLFSLPVSFIYTQARLSHFEIVFKHYNSIST
jgi:hypothetical protein